MLNPPTTVSGGGAAIAGEWLAESPPTPKGHGLKKWRRRRMRQDITAAAVPVQILKRRIPPAEPFKAQKSDGEGSVASNSAEAAPSDQNLVLAAPIGGFSVGVESDTGEDRGSTAAVGKDRSRGKGGGRRDLRGRGGGGGRMRVEKQSLQQCSIGRSPNAGFARRCSSAAASSSGQRSERSVNDGGERRGDADGQEHSTDLNPLIDSIVLLQAAQEALEREIQKFEEMSKDPILGNSNGQLEGIEWSGSPAREAHFLELNRKIHLEYRLKEASTIIKVKESKLLKLESDLNRTHLAKKETKSSDRSYPQENFKEMEVGLEGIVRERIEAGIEYLIRARASESWKVQIEDQSGRLEEQKSLVKDQAHMMLKLQDAHNKAIILKEQTEKLEARFKALLGTEEVLKLQNKVYISSLCCCVQLVMLCITIWWFLIQLLTPSDGIVPT